MILKPLQDKPLRPWEMPILFPASHRIEKAHSIIVEVGPGRGDFLYHLALEHPESLVVAIEIKRKRVDRLVQRLQKRGIANVILIQDDAREAVPRFFRNNTISEIHINFPDPWPKNRHAKNRLMTEKFVRTCTDKLRSGGELNFATDQEWYAHEVQSLFRSISALQPHRPGDIEINPEERYPTLFMQKWRKIGRTLHYQSYYKVN